MNCILTAQQLLHVRGSHEWMDWETTNSLGATQMHMRPIDRTQHLRWQSSHALCHVQQSDSVCVMKITPLMPSMGRSSGELELILGLRCDFCGASRYESEVSSVCFRSFSCQPGRHNSSLNEEGDTTDTNRKRGD